MKCHKESRKTQKAEEKYLKKGGAPKALIKHEKREHAVMNKRTKSKR